MTRQEALALLNAAIDAYGHDCAAASHRGEDEDPAKRAEVAEAVEEYRRAVEADADARSSR